jgi:transposase InsO family protein
VLARDFTAAAPNQRWVSDTTEFAIGDSAKLYLAAVLDLFSRFIVGWSISASMIDASRRRHSIWRSRVVAPTLSSCTTRIVAATRTPAKTTKRISPARASPAA